MPPGKKKIFGKNSAFPVNLTPFSRNNFVLWAEPLYIIFQGGGGEFEPPEPPPPPSDPLVGTVICLFTLSSIYNFLTVLLKIYFSMIMQVI